MDFLNQAGFTSVRIDDVHGVNTCWQFFTVPAKDAGTRIGCAPLLHRLPLHVHHAHGLHFGSLRQHNVYFSAEGIGVDVECIVGVAATVILVA